MIRLIHASTGGEMWVHESRLDEYLAAGHKIYGAPVRGAAAEPKPAAKKPRKAKAKERAP